MILKKKFYPLKNGYVLHLITAKDKKGVFFFIGVFDAENQENPIEKFYFRNSILANRKYKECREKYSQKKTGVHSLESTSAAAYNLSQQDKSVDMEGSAAENGNEVRTHAEKFLQECRPELYKSLFSRMHLDSHLKEIQKQAEMRLEFLITRQKRLEGVTEEMKATDQLQWVGMMNNIKASAEEIILNELIYN